MEKDITIWNY